MAQTYLFEIGTKAGVVDPVGRGLKQDILHLGLARVKNVASSQLYRLTGKLSAEERTSIAKDLLCDPILNESCSGEVLKKDKSMVVDIWYKQGVTDVVGDSVLKGIKDLNISGVQDVRTGMRYRFQGVTRRETAQKIAQALLANPLVHESIISATGAPADQAKQKARHAD